ncbi:MAG TPA: UDP-N-acetylmuramate dehydrogenase [Caldisericia bacterium]|nr:UDP-N-acetylmuramate dehydrogenase [Caldisericia bacterium]HQL67357.1 UDP-N-acetylmuramate dehydrogenase [Caldisericia bacterium]
MKLKDEILFNLIKGKIYKNYEIKNMTTFKVGGKVDYLIIPKDYDDIRLTLKFGKDNNIPVYLMGNGSNLLISDRGVRGIIIRISKENFNKKKIKNNLITSESGVLLYELISISVRNELSGLEFLHGIPGALGGVIAMNAGTDGSSISDYLREIKVMDSFGEIHILPKEEFGFTYRNSLIVEKKLIVLEALIELKKSKKENIFSTLKYKVKKRKLTQPINYPTAGCVFKNEGDNKAGYLIEKAGCKGLRVGDAEVSMVHANFIFNRGNATFSDVISLMKMVKERVYEKFNINLNPEVIIMGEVEEEVPFKILEPW